MQTNSVHTFPSYVPKIRSNIIFPSTPTFFVWSFPFAFSDQNFVRISRLPHACYMPRPIASIIRVLAKCAASEALSKMLQSPCHLANARSIYKVYSKRDALESHTSLIPSPVVYFLVDFYQRWIWLVSEPRHSPRKASPLPTGYQIRYAM
jgi:hypothetical protein